MKTGPPASRLGTALIETRTIAECFTAVAEVLGGLLGTLMSLLVAEKLGIPVVPGPPTSSVNVAEGDKS